MGMNEAIFYISYLPANVKKILCIKKAVHPKKEETLAEYYCRIDGHLLREVDVYEVDDLGQLCFVRKEK